MGRTLGPRGMLYPTSEEGPYVDGKRHGHWVERVDNGNVSEGPYVDGLKHGRWVSRQFDGDRYVNVWVHGRIQGRSSSGTGRVCGRAAHRSHVRSEVATSQAGRAKGEV